MKAVAGSFVLLVHHSFHQGFGGVQVFKIVAKCARFTTFWKKFGAFGGAFAHVLVLSP
jgi:hypothetical protein